MATISPGVEGELADGDEDQRRHEGEDQGHHRPHEEPGERADRGQQQDQDDVEPARGGAQRDAVEDGRDRVRLDLGARHQFAAVGGLLDVLEDRRGGADDDDLVLEPIRVDPAVEDVDVGVGGDRLRRSRVVDPGATIRRVEAVVFDEFALRHFGGDDGEAFEVLQRVGEAPHRAVGVGDVDGVPGPRPDLPQDRVAAEDRVLALGAHFAGGEDDVAGVVDGFDQRVVIAGVGCLGELDVEGDRLGPVFDQAVDHFRVQPPRERPLQLQFAEGVVVDPDDRQFRRGLLRRRGPRTGCRRYPVRVRAGVRTRNTRCRSPLRRQRRRQRR